MNIHTKTTTSEKPHRFSLCVLASGSKGNATFISDGTTSVLLDAGLSGIEIERRMRFRGLSPRNLDAILVSHEHHDHIRGVGVLSRRFDLPVYISPRTEKAGISHLGNIYSLRHFECGSKFNINTLTIHPFSISHDAQDPAGFTISQNGTKIGIATDLGIATALVRTHLKDCAALILEANHDPEMLTNGPYPWHLKQRVKGRSGHLSNEDTRELLREIRHDRLSHVVLAHLSEINNTPEKALSVVGNAMRNCRIHLIAASQQICTEILNIT